MAEPHSQNFGYQPAVNPTNTMSPLPGGHPMYQGGVMTGSSYAPGPYKGPPLSAAPPPGHSSMPPSPAPMTGPNSIQPGPPPRFGDPGGTRPPLMQLGSSSMTHSPAPMGMGPGMPQHMPPVSIGQRGVPTSAQNPMMPPKAGMMMPRMSGAPPNTSMPGPPPAMMNGVPAGPMGLPQGQPPPPPRPFLNGPPTNGPHIPPQNGPPSFMNGPPMRPGPPHMAPQMTPPPRPGQPPPPAGHFGQRPPGPPPPGVLPPSSQALPPLPPPTSMGGSTVGPPPQGPPQMGGSILPGGLPPPPPPAEMTSSPTGRPAPGQNSGVGGGSGGAGFLELPAPYSGQGQYARQLNPGGVTPTGLTPTNSEPVSQKSSRAPSPTPGPNYDALEGGQPWSPNGAPPPQPSGAAPVGPGPGQPPMPGQLQQIQQQPKQQPLLAQPGIVAPGGGGVPGAAPQMQDMQRSAGGITGKRHYPQMPGLNTQVPPPPMTGGQSQAPVPGTVGMNSTMAGQPSTGYGPQVTNGQYANNVNQLSSSFNAMKVGPPAAASTADRPINLMQERTLIPPEGVETMRPSFAHDHKKVNVSPDIFRCTLSTLPQSQSLLNKSRLPLGILIHPFKDLSQLPVIQSTVIVRCRSCRTYINPFVTFVDMRRWKCNLCYRINELPDEFNFDPVSKTYGEPQRRPEIRSATIEFIAPAEYMLRPPQPAVYLYILDVSFNAVSTGYLSTFCQTLIEEIDKIPGDSRTQVGFITFDSALHFYNLSQGLSQPQMLVVSDVDDVFLPCPDSLLVNLHESKSLVLDLLNQLPNTFENTMDNGNALGAALQAAYKLMGATGGRVSVFQTQLPSVGPGALKNREDPNERAGKKVQYLGPATDFYKKMSLECSAQQIAVDLFLMSTQYSDLASIACISKYSGGCVHYFPGLHANNTPVEMERLENTLRRYFIRKVGFEAVMRIRCTRGMAIHTFHGNFFVRSTDLLSLPNINPDAGFGMQMSIEDTLETSTACFQAALLYTSSKGERRIRVHTMCLPVTNNLSDVYAGADQLAIVGLLSKMAVDKCASQSLTDARDAMINASIDMLGAYGQTLAASQRVGQLPVSFNLRLMPLYAVAMLKYLGFRLGTSTRLDERVFALEQCKTLPLCYLLLEIYPALYPVHALDDKMRAEGKSLQAAQDPPLPADLIPVDNDQSPSKPYVVLEENALSKGDTMIPQPPLLQLSSASLDRHGAFLMDTGSYHYLWLGAAISDRFCQEVFDVPNFASVPDGLMELPDLENPTSERLHSFIGHLNDQRPVHAGLLVIRDDSRQRMRFLQHMVEDRTESSMSYYEFLQHLQKEVKS